MSLTSVVAPSPAPETVAALVGERLSLSALHQLGGTLGGYSFVKVVVDREQAMIHFLNAARHSFHAIYIGEEILGVSEERVRAEIDSYNETFYHAPDRRFLLGILALHPKMLSLETVEVDTMPAALIREFYAFVAQYVDPSLPLVFKPANQRQERIVREIPASELPRVFAHELFSTAPFVALNPGTATGRLRAFRTEAEYRAAHARLDRHHRAGPACPTTSRGSRGSSTPGTRHRCRTPTCSPPAGRSRTPSSSAPSPRSSAAGSTGSGSSTQWTPRRRRFPCGRSTGRPRRHRGRAGTPSASRWRSPRPTTARSSAWRGCARPTATVTAPRRPTSASCTTSSACGSQRLLGFYQVPRPPRDNLLPYLARLLDVPDGTDLAAAARRLLDDRVRVPRGIALPFSLQQRFLESSPRIQQAIGKLKMALELDAREIEPLCVELQSLIRSARMPGTLAGEIDSALVSQLAGVRAFVVRSSSNAEDLAGFSAAGIYESRNHVTTAERIFASVKEVWASLVSVRSVRLRQQAGISLDDCYMGVVIQEQVAADFGGVLVTTNPMNRADFRTVYVNVSPKVTDVVDGSALPMQYLYKTVEGGGRTVSLGDAPADLDEAAHAQLQRLAVAGRLLQAHFSPDYTFDSPVDIEWLADGEHLHLVQLRPYSA